MDHGPRRSESVGRGAAALVLACVLVAAIIVSVVLEHRTAPKTALGPLPIAAPVPGAPIFEPRVATRMALVASPLGVSPDGFARWLVRVRFASADGAATQLVSGGGHRVYADAR